VKILVTGGSGFIGSHIVEHYQDKADEIRILDNLRTGYRKNLDGLKHVFIEGSVTDREIVAKASTTSFTSPPWLASRSRWPSRANAWTSTFTACSTCSKPPPRPA
jgi:dTDP-D-glucose 4,6-dehydratase